MTPLVSTIIPTFNRPQYLPRAIESALTGMACHEVEVIVVPNGPDSSWKKSLTKYDGNTAVRVLPITIGHANKARNHGLANANGKYVRFLDDDDYLYPEEARKQIELLEKTGADICSGLIENLDEDESTLGTLSFPETNDFVCAILTMSGLLLPTGNLYRKSSIENLQWNEEVNRAQDYVWMLEMAGENDWHWVHHNEIVGVWFQHAGIRTSTVQIAIDRPTKTIDSILLLHKKLSSARRLSANRRDAIAGALWNFINWRFPYQPIYWSEIAKKAKEISPYVRPSHPIFNNPLFRYVDPLLLEIAMFPIRRLTNSYRNILRNLFGWDYRRRL